MQSQRTVREPEREPAGAAPPATELQQPPVGVPARSQATEAQQAFIASFQDEINILNLRLRPDAATGADMALFSILSPLSYIRGGATSEERSGGELLDKFARNEMQFLVLNIDPSDAADQYGVEQLLDYVQQSPDPIPQYTLIRDPGNPTSITIRNNWFVPFSREEASEIVTLLKCAQGLDENGMAQVQSMYGSLKDLAMKTYALKMSETFFCNFPGSESLREAFGEILSSYSTLDGQALGAMRAVVNGDPNAGTLITLAAQTAENADLAYDNAHFRIAENFEIFDPVSQDPALAQAMRDIQNQTDMFVQENGAWSRELAFTKPESELFDSLYSQYLSLLEPIRERRYELSAYVLGIPPGTVLHPLSNPAVVVEGISEEDVALFRKFMGVASTLQLFLAKARFLSIEADYREYQEYRSEYMRTRMPDAGFPEAGSMAAEFDRAVSNGEIPNSVANFHVNLGRYERELAGLRDKLSAYSSLIEEFMVYHTPPLTEFFGTDQKAAYFLSLHPIREREGGAVREGGLDSMMRDANELMGTLGGGMTGMAQYVSGVLEERDMQSMFESGFFTRWFYVMPKAFLNEAGITFPIICAAGGAAVGFAVAGPAGIAPGAKLGFAAATIIEVPLALSVGIHALSDLGEEGISGERAYGDLRTASQFLLIGGMATAGGTRLGWRVFSTASFGLGAGFAGARIFEDLRRGDPMALIESVADLGVVAVGGYMFIRGTRGIMQARAGVPAAISASEIRVATPFGFESVQLPTVAEWGAFPYSMRGTTSFFIFGAGLETMLNPDEIALILERDGVAGLAGHFNETYLRHSNSFPVINVIGMGAFSLLGRAARGAYGAIRPPAPTAPTALEALQIPTANPGLSACMGELGAGSNAFSLATNYGLDVSADRELVRRLYTVALSGRDLSREEVARIFGAYLEPLGERAGAFMDELISSTNSIRTAASDLASGATLTRSASRRVREVVRSASANATEFAMEATGLTFGAFGFYDVMELTPAYQERVAALDSISGMLDAIASDPATSYFLLSTLAQKKFPGFGRGFGLQEMEPLNLAAATVFRRIEEGYEGYSDFSERLKEMLPGEQDRFNLVYGAAVALLGQRGEGETLGLQDLDLFTEDLGKLVWNMTNFLSTPTDLGSLSTDPAWYEKKLDWTGMGLSDFFLASSYLLYEARGRSGIEGAQEQLSGLVHGFADGYRPELPQTALSGYLWMDKTREAIANPQFARIAIAALYQSHFMETSADWRAGAVCRLSEIIEAEEGGLSGVNKWRGEILAEIFRSGPFATLRAMSQVDADALTGLVRAIHGTDSYPASVYYSEDYARFSQ